MKLDRRALKQAARQTMAGARPRPVLVTLVSLLITYAVTFGVSIAMGMAGIVGVSGSLRHNPSYAMVSFLLYLISMLFAVVMQAGYTSYTLRLADGQEGGFRDLFAGFPETGRVLLLNLALAGFFLAWYFVVAAASMTPVVFGLMFLMMFLMVTAGETAAAVVTVAIMLLALLAAAAFLLFVLVRYALSVLILMDDFAVGPLNAVRRSRALLRGRNKEYFLLQLSFLGWALPAIVFYLGAILLGAFVFKTDFAIGLCVLVGLLPMIPTVLWLQPYVMTTNALYYRTLVPRSEELAPPADEIIPDTPWRV